MNIKLTSSQIQILIQIIDTLKYSPKEWEEIIRPIYQMLKGVPKDVQQVDGKME